MALGAAHADERAELEQLRNTTLGLIQALVDQGLLTQERAQALIKQAGSRPAVTAATAPATGASAPAPGTVRVPYIPETLKAQIKDEIRLEVLADAREGGWADARKFPPWLGGLRIEGDLRVRGESDLFSASNTPASLYRSQVSSPAWSPDLVNTQKNRSRLTLRARLGVVADLSDSLSAGVRIATANNPTSESQTLGATPGYFNSYSVGLDRGWVRWEPLQGTHVDAGRIARPFFGTDLLWPDDLSLDGVSVHAEHNIGSGAYAFGTLGGFVLQEQQLGGGKWLVGGQLGGHWDLEGKTQLTLAAGMYDFLHVEGVAETSPPPSGALAGTVPYYASQYPVGARLRGNTLINLNDPTNTGAPVWGLASKFRPFNLSAALNFDQLSPVHVGVTLDYVKNSAFDVADIERRAGTTAVADLANKTTGLQARMQLGSRNLEQRGDWSTFFALRRFERDAWVDALTDTTWNLGGTNYQGYSLGGSYAFDRHATLGVRWTSTRNLDDGRRFLSVPTDPTSVTGNLSSAPLKIDVIQVEVNAKF